MTETDPIDDLRDALDRIHHLEREIESLYRQLKEKDVEIERLKKPSRRQKGAMQP